MNRFYTFIDDIADFLVSLAFLVPVFFAFMAYRFYEIYMLFEPELSQLNNIENTVLGALLIGGVGIFTTLIFMVHSDKLAPVPFKDDAGQTTWRWDWSKLILVLYAFVINAFFWRPWEGKDLPDVIFRWFCCVMFSSMDFGFAHLFNSLHRDRKQEHDLSTLEQKLSNIEQNISEEEHELSTIRAQADKLKAFIQDHTCKHCGDPFPSPRSRRAHEPNCSASSPSPLGEGPGVRTKPQKP